MVPNIITSNIPMEFKAELKQESFCIFPETIRIYLIFNMDSGER